jgi:hypothetical protein
MMVPELARYRNTDNSTWFCMLLHPLFFDPAFFWTIQKLALQTFFYSSYTITPRCGILSRALQMKSRARICKPYTEPRIRFPACRNRIPRNLFLVSLKGLQIWAQKKNLLASHKDGLKCRLCLKVHKIENFLGSDFEFCGFSLLVMLKY